MVQRLFIRNVLIFPQNPFHRAHKDLRPAHCHHREITLPIEKREMSCSTFPVLVSGFQVSVLLRATLYSSYLNRCKSGFVRRQRAKSDFSREIGFSTHAEDSEAPGKYLEHFTRHL